MPKFFVKENEIYNDIINIVGEDVKHIANVLRKEIGDTLNICNISTSDNFLCQIIEIEKEYIKCKIIDKIEDKTESEIEITVFQGLPKYEKMELIIQKCTEIGVTDFYPVSMERCIVKLDSKNEEKKVERWQKIAETAAKQSGRNIIPQIKNIINLKKLCNLFEKYDIVLLAYENEKENTLKNALKTLKNTYKSKIGIIIGPEGGLSESEVKTLKDAGAISITLGNRILRTATVGLVMSSIILNELEK